MSFESLNGMEYIGAHLKFKVSGFKEKVDGHLYYQILATFTLREPYKHQDLSYTYQHCLSLCQALQTQCPNIPLLSSYSVFGFKPTAIEVERRRIELEKWLMALVWRSDVIGTKEFQEFCNINNLIEDRWLDPPQPSIELKIGHLFGVVDFSYDPDTQVCFVATSDDSLASKLSGLLNIFSKSPGLSKSQILCYRLDVNDEGDPSTRCLWKNNYANKITKILWDEQLTILVLGFDTGQIIVLRVSSENKYKECSEFSCFTKHSNSIQGLATNSLGGDRFLITTDLTNPNNVLKEKEFPYELTCMLQHKEHKRLFIGDAGGSVYIFHYEEGPLQAAHQIKPNIKMSITTIQFYPKKSFLLIGTREGIVMVFELGRPGKEKLTSLVTQLETVPNQKSLLFSLTTKELYVNYNNNVLIVDSMKVKSLYSLGAHKEVVTKMEMFEDIGLMVTAGRDCAVRFWQYKDFTHTQMEKHLQQFRGFKNVLPSQQEEEEKSSNTQNKVQIKPQLEDLDDWQQ